TVSELSSLTGATRVGRGKDSPRRGAMTWGLAVRGKQTKKVVPCPTALSTHTAPQFSRMIFRTVLRPSPVPFPSGLVVKNGSQSGVCWCGLDAVAVIPTRQHGEGSGGVAVRRRFCFVVFGFIALNGVFPAVRHGVARVQYQVHQHLFHLPRIRHCFAQI